MRITYYHMNEPDPLVAGYSTITHYIGCISSEYMYTAIWESIEGISDQDRSYVPRPLTD